jgi:coenzyme F420-reducing hydrogenase alpha subunit
MSGDERTFHVELLTRVEGEGRFTLRLRDGAVVGAELAIFEAPRYYEALLRGRSCLEAPDIVARICGICPVAYQMSACAAIEAALGLRVPDALRRLRRLLYCGEWIESHALHVFMLHAPDLLGYPSAVEMARDHRELVERGLALKRAGNRLLEVLGGRATHPVSPRVGGFTKVPSGAELRRLVPDLERACAIAAETARAASRWPFPELEVPYVFVAADAPDYPLERAEALLVGSSGGDSHADGSPGGGPRPAAGGRRVALDAWDEHFAESQVPHSNALHCRLADGGIYLTGPQARLFHHADKLHPRARDVAAEIGLGRAVLNPYRSLLVRCVELVHATAEALDLIATYEAPSPPFVAPVLRAGTGAGATEAPRGTLVHRYTIDDAGLLTDARIVPPTSQNQARIEADLAALGPALIALDHDEATHRCEQLIRAYDPCISCATHFLRLCVVEEGSPP